MRCAFQRAQEAFRPSHMTRKLLSRFMVERFGKECDLTGRLDEFGYLQIEYLSVWISRHGNVFGPESFSNLSETISKISHREHRGHRVNSKSKSQIQHLKFENQHLKFENQHLKFSISNLKFSNLFSVAKKEDRPRSIQA